MTVYVFFIIRNKLRYVKEYIHVQDHQLLILDSTKPTVISHIFFIVEVVEIEWAIQVSSLSTVLIVRWLQPWLFDLFLFQTIGNSFATDFKFWESITCSGMTFFVCKMCNRYEIWQNP